MYSTKPLIDEDGLWQSFLLNKSFSLQEASSMLEDASPAAVAQTLNRWTEQGKIDTDGEYFFLPYANDSQTTEGTPLETVQRGEIDHVSNWNEATRKSCDRGTLVQELRDRGSTCIETNEGTEERVSAQTQIAGIDQQADSLSLKHPSRNRKKISGDVKPISGWIIQTQPGGSNHTYNVYRWMEEGRQYSRHIPGGNILRPLAIANRKVVEEAIKAGKSTKEIRLIIRELQSSTPFGSK